MENKHTRVFVIADIHGKNTFFRKTLKEIGLKKTDKLVLLGDIIDRGEDTKGTLDTILLLLENGFDIICLIGNHEKMFLDAFNNTNNLNLWLLNGGDKTLSSFLTSSIEKIPRKYIDLIKSFRNYYLYDKYILVHAALNMKIENPFSDTEVIIWSREPSKFINNEWLGNRLLIHGHNPIDKNEILTSIRENDRIVNIDNGVYMRKEGYGGMCVLELKTHTINFIYENN